MISHNVLWGRIVDSFPHTTQWKELKTMQGMSVWRIPWKKEGKWAIEAEKCRWQQSWSKKEYKKGRVIESDRKRGNYKHRYPEGGNATSTKYPLESVCGGACTQCAMRIPWERHLLLLSCDLLLAIHNHDGSCVSGQATRCWMLSSSPEDAPLTVLGSTVTITPTSVGL